MTTSSPAKYENYLALSSSLMGEDGGGGEHGMSPLTNRAFKRVLIDKAETFDFLDPFGGEFEYREGTIRFSGEAREKDFAKGMVEGLHSTLLLLEKELPKEKMLPLKLKAEIASSLEPHSETLKRLGVDTLLSSFFQ